MTKTNVTLAIGSQEVHGIPPTLEQLCGVLSSVSRSEVTSVICFIGSHWSGDNPAEWMTFDRDRLRPLLLSPSTQAALKRYERQAGANTVLFTKRRALTLLRLAHAVCTSANPPVPGVNSAALNAIGEAFLLVGGLMDEKSEGELADPIGLIVPAFEEANPPSLMLSLARTYKMALDPSWGKEPILREATVRFARRYGLAIRDYLCVVVGLMTKLMSRGDKEGHGLVKLSDAFSRARDREGIKLSLDALSIPYASIAASVGTDSTKILRSASQEPFRSRPLIAFHDDVFACTDFNALGDQLSSGLFWKILALFTTKSEQDQVFSAWGKLFERPVSARLQHAVDSGFRCRISRPRYLDSPHDVDGDELTDALITCGPNLILLEFKAFVLTEKAKYSGDSDVLIEEARRKLLKDTKNGLQVVRALKRLFASEDLTRKYLRGRKVRTIYPAVVCLDHAITAPTVGPKLNELFSAQVAAANLPRDLEIKPLSLLNADDVDVLAAVIAAGKKPHAIFRERFEVDSLGANTFHNHLFDVMNRLGIEKPGEPEEFSRLFEDAKTYWLAQGKPEVFVQ